MSSSIFLCIVSMQKTAGRSEIVITNADKEDIATFTCQAENGVTNSVGEIIVDTEETKIDVVGRFFLSILHSNSSRPDEVRWSFVS